MDFVSHTQHNIETGRTDGSTWKHAPVRNGRNVQIAESPTLCDTTTLGRGANMKNKNRLITKEWLEQQNACSDGKAWFMAQNAGSVSVVINKLIKENRFDWANWTITKMMTQQQNVYYACFCATRSVENFERVFPSDKRPRQAIEAALKWANDPTEDNKSAARSAARSAESAARSAAWSAELAAWSATSAARSATSAAWSAELAAWSAESAAWSAESAARSVAESAAWSAESAAWKRILLFGVKLVLGLVAKEVFSKWKI
jgi:hypothetical protein